ncbi:cell wall-binding repeat-containing protein [Lihuaxuella thermophila]|uniref:Putative cell wall-binding protein n=1 Tax=Lihuaxuella thermophila TaxID=1173111 RepID=A0A1H8B805_9BACL|nr:cell wall-binding repeat-containing protein [Lihuaxuella thermophila]SEM78027.1 Putative cell wall-binding protein [Lihuaxuella thermophila]
MSRWKSKGGMLFVSGIVAAVAFSLPVYPSSWAKPPVVKILADDVRQQFQSDFAKGKSDKVKMEAEGKQAVLTLPGTEKKAVYTSPVIQSDIVFTDVGIHWINDSLDKKASKNLIRFEVRTSPDGENWTKWTRVQVGDDREGPDSKQNAETFGDLIYAGKASYAQYRVHLQKGQKLLPRVKDIKLTFINARDGKKVESKQSFWQVLFDAVDAAVDRPKIKTRAEWGADESLRYDANGNEVEPREYFNVTHLVVHHTGHDLAIITDPETGQKRQQTPEEALRADYYYHAKTKGWGDLAYNAVIGPDGTIYEGRKGKDGAENLLSDGVVGFHAYSFNKGTFGVSVMGNYDNKPLPRVMRNSLINLLSYEAKLWNINPTGTADFVRNYEYDDPNVPKVDYKVPTIQGHGLLPRAQTACPGAYIKPDLPNIRNDVALTIKARTNLKRVAGADRYGTSASISNEISALGNLSDTVVIARGDDFPDALSGGPLAAKSKSPILLTPTSTLKPDIQAEIQRRKPTNAVILGGTGAVSANVETQLKNLGVTNVTRIAGADRYVVSASIANQVTSGGTADTAIIASGLNFPDALAASSIAAQEGWPILLVKTDLIPTPIQQFIDNHPEIKNFYIVGGSGVVSDRVKTQLATKGTVTRIDGANRFATAVNVAKTFNMSASSLVFANGNGFPDALSGGPLAAYTASPVILTKPSVLPTEVQSYLTGKKGEFQKGYILGGEGVVYPEVERQIASYTP